MIATNAKFTHGRHVCLVDVCDRTAIETALREHGPRLAGVVTEVPTNPLVQTPDLPAIAALCRQHGARLVVDPSMSSVFSLNVLPHADLLVSSLTKYTASKRRNAGSRSRDRGRFPPD